MILLVISSSKYGMHDKECKKVQAYFLLILLTNSYVTMVTCSMVAMVIFLNLTTMHGYMLTMLKVNSMFTYIAM